MKRDFPRKFRLENARRLLAIRQRRAAALKAISSGNVRAVRLINSRGEQLIIHPSTYPQCVGQWQITTFSPDGCPWGHTNAPTLTEAVLRGVGASRNGYYNEHGYHIAEIVTGAAVCMTN